MQRIDTTAITTYSIPRLLLMDHAGLGVARAVQSLSVRPGATRVFVCCGTGYNGGDGLAAARYLHEWGYPLDVLVLGRLNTLRAEPATFAAILQRLRVPITEVTSLTTLSQATHRLARCRLIIDALLGLGMRGVVREPMASLIKRMNDSGRPIIAADIPSGLDGDTGRVANVAVRATMTVTFGLAKRGCLRGEGPGYTGSLIIDPITIPRVLLEGKS